MEARTIRKTRKFYSREDTEVAQQVREALSQNCIAEWHNTYETFYGVGWEGWVRKQLEGIPCQIIVTHWSRLEGYPDMLVIVPESREDRP